MSWNRKPAASGGPGRRHRLAGWPLSGALTAAILLAGAPAAQAADATVSWAASGNPYVAGYTVHYGRSSGAYDAAVDVGLATSWTATGLADGVAYYFALSTRDQFGQESVLSDEVVFGGGGGGGDVTPLFVDTFDDGGRGGDPDWKRVKGAWKVDRQTHLRPATRKDNLAVVADPQLQGFMSGRIETDVRLVRRSGTRPNAAIVFHHTGTGAHRYVQIKPSGVVLGQVGAVPGQATAFRFGRKMRVTANQWHHLRLDVDDAGQVSVYLDDMESPVLVWQLPVSYGSIGFKARKAAVLFDNVAVWDTSVLP